MIYACRCRNSACQARRTLSKHPDEFVRPPRCKSCGSQQWRWDKHRDKVEKNKRPCGCSGYWFAHRKGSKWCHNNPKIEGLMALVRAA